MGMFGNIDVAAAEVFTRPGADTYKMIISRFEIKPTKNDENKIGLTICFTHADDEKYPGWDHFEWFELPPEDSEDFDKKIGRVKKRLLTLGIPEERMNDLEPEDVLMTEVYVTLKNKKVPDESNPTYIGGVVLADSIPDPRRASKPVAKKAAAAVKANPFR